MEEFFHRFVLRIYSYVVGQVIINKRKLNFIMMKYYYHFTLFLVFLFVSFSSCRKDKDEDTDPGGNTDANKEELLFKGFELLEAGYAEYYNFAEQYNGNAPVALYETGKWILNKGIAEDVYIIDSTYMYIVMSSEIILNLNINYVDDDGKSVFRGGPQGGNALMQLRNPQGRNAMTLLLGSCSNTIPNNSVLMWGAAADLNFDYATIKGILDNSDVDFTYTELETSQCTPASLKTINQYGLVLFDTHGYEDAMLTGSSVYLRNIANAQALKETIISAIGEENFLLFLSGTLRLSSSVYGRLSPDVALPSNTIKKGTYDVLATVKFIQSLPMLSNTIVLNNSCYSGATLLKSALKNVNGEPVTLAQTVTVANVFLSRNPIAYYGWRYDDATAGPIIDGLAIEAEESFIKRLAEEKDSTGQAYLQMNGDYFQYSHPRVTGGKELKLRQFNNDSYCYPDSCGGTFTDPRDGQTYKKVCIGKQVWMAENLNYNAPNSYCYNDDPNLCAIYGRLYTWNAAATACPPGWHLPSKSEWNTLFDELGGSSVAGGKMKATTEWNAPNTGATDSSGWTALPGGNRDTSGNYRNLNNNGTWWTSSLDSFLAPIYRGEAFSLDKDYQNVFTTMNFLNVSNSCRCIQD